MNALQSIPAILLWFIVAATLYAQSELRVVDPVLEICPCDSGSAVSYEWGVWVDRDGDGQYDYRLYRKCNRFLTYWVEGKTLWDEIAYCLQLEVGDAMPTLRKSETDTGTIWSVEERDSVSGAVIGASWLDSAGHPMTSCKYKVNGTRCYLAPDSIEPSDKPELKIESVRVE